MILNQKIFFVFIEGGRNPTSFGRCYSKKFNFTKNQNCPKYEKKIEPYHYVLPSLINNTSMKCGNSQ